MSEDNNRFIQSRLLLKRQVNSFFGMVIGRHGLVHIHVDGDAMKSEGPADHHFSQPPSQGNVMREERRHISDGSGSIQISLSNSVLGKRTRASHPAADCSGGLELLLLAVAWITAKHQAQAGHLKTLSSLPSSLCKSPVLKHPASAGGTREPMCVVKLSDPFPPVATAIMKTVSERRAARRIRISQAPGL